MKNAMSQFLVRLGERPYACIAFAQGEQPGGPGLSRHQAGILQSGQRDLIYAAAGVADDLAPPKIIAFPRALALV